MEGDHTVDEAPKFAIGKSKFFCVEYPGYVKNMDRAMDTLGGEKTLAKSLTKNSFVELRFRPKDPFSHPINGDIIPTAKLLLKVTRRVKKGQSEEDAMYKTEIVGTIPKSCRFRGLADFQYIVPATDSTRRLKNAMLHGNVDELIQHRIADDDDNFEDLRNIPPPQFTTVETPLRYNFDQSTPVTRVRVRQPDGSFTTRLVNRSRKLQQDSSKAFYEDEQIPMQSAHELNILQEKDAVEVKTRMEKLFDERPIWTKGGIKSFIDPAKYKYINLCVAHIAYTFQTGPWRDCWIKYGIDPRKDQVYNIYQLIDIRRVYGADLAPYERAKRSRLLPRFNTNGAKDNVKQEPDSSEGIEESHTFDGSRRIGTLWSYQLCDIVDPDIAPLINNPKYLRPTCTRASGFYYKCVFDRLRSSLRKKRLELETGVPEPIPDIEAGLDQELAKEMEEEANAINSSLTAMVDDYMNRLDAASDEEMELDEYEDLLKETEDDADGAASNMGG